MGRLQARVLLARPRAVSTLPALVPRRAAGASCCSGPAQPCLTQCHAREPPPKGAARDRTSSNRPIRALFATGDIIRSVSHAAPALETSAHFPHRQYLATADSTLGGFQHGPTTRLAAPLHHGPHRKSFTKADIQRFDSMLLLQPT